MNNSLLLNSRPEPIIVENCPNCKSDNIRWQSAFDFKYRVICKACGYHTQWHLNSLADAVNDWNNQEKELEKMPTLCELYEKQNELDAAIADMPFDWKEICEIELTNQD